VNEIHRRVFVRCPIGEAAERFDQFFNDNANAEGTVCFALRACAHLPALETEITLKRDVVVSLRRPRMAAAQGGCLVDWLPAGGGAFPRFCGALAIESAGDDDTFSLVIDGRYETPKRFAAQALEGIGHRIAQATARDLLTRVRDDVEVSYRLKLGTPVPDEAEAGIDLR